MSLADERRRPREEPHQRSIQEQTLDALLRIEELMTTLVARSAFPAAPPAAGTPPEPPAKPKGRTR